MAEKLTWQLVFETDTNGVATGISQLSVLGQKTEGATAGLGKLGGAASGAGMAVGAAAGVMVAALGTVVAAIGAATVAATALDAKLSEAFGQRSSQIRTYTTLLGDAAKASEEYSKAQRVALLTDLTSEATEKAQKQLLIARFRGSTLDRALLAGLDIATTATDKNQALESYARARSQIAGKGRLQQEELLQLAEGTGLGTKLVHEELEKMGFKNAAEQISKGKVNAEAAGVAIERAILTQLNTKRLGDFATGSAGSVTSMEGNKAEAFANLAKSFDSEALTGIKSYKTALGDLNSTLDTGSASGRQLSVVLQHFADMTGETKGVVTQFEDAFLKSFAEAYTTALAKMDPEASKNAFVTLTQFVRGLGETAGKVGTAVAYVVQSVGPALNTLAEGARVASAVVQNLYVAVTQVVGGIVEFVGAVADVTGVTRVIRDYADAYSWLWDKIKVGLDGVKFVVGGVLEVVGVAIGYIGSLLARLPGGAKVAAGLQQFAATVNVGRASVGTDEVGARIAADQREMAQFGTDEGSRKGGGGVGGLGGGGFKDWRKKKEKPHASTAGHGSGHEGGGFRISFGGGIEGGSIGGGGSSLTSSPVAAAVEATTAPRRELPPIHITIVESKDARATALEVRKVLEQLFLTEAPQPGYKTG